MLFILINSIYHKNIIQINIYSSYQMVYIGKTFNLWYLVIDQMENICNSYLHNKHNVSNINQIHLFC